MEIPTRLWPYPPGFSPVTAKLIDLLSKGRVGDSHDDHELINVAGVDCSVHQKGYGSLNSAIRHVQRVHGIVWRRMRNQGRIQCLDANQRVELAELSRLHVSRVTRRAVQILSTVQPDDISAAARPEVGALSAQLSALLLFSSTETKKRLQGGKVTETPKLKQLLEPFLG